MNDGKLWLRNDETFNGLIKVCDADYSFNLIDEINKLKESENISMDKIKVLSKIVAYLMSEINSLKAIIALNKINK